MTKIKLVLGSLKHFKTGIEPTFQKKKLFFHPYSKSMVFSRRIAWWFQEMFEIQIKHAK